MKAIMTGIAVAALIAASPALAGGEMQVAQVKPQAEQTQDMQSTAECPAGATETAEGEPCAPDAAAAPQDESDITTGSLPEEESEAAAQTDELAGESNEMVAVQGGKFLEEQSDNAILASELVGLTVYNPADEALGDVNDIVWTDDGGVEAVILGVGGFLGIGEKAVAVAYSAIDFSSDENGNKKLVLSATEDELAAAPTFVTAAEKLAMMRAEEEQKLPPATGGSLIPAPAPTE